MLDSLYYSEFLSIAIRTVGYIHTISYFCTKKSDPHGRSRWRGEPIVAFGGTGPTNEIGFFYILSILLTDTLYKASWNEKGAFLSRILPVLVMIFAGLFEMLM